ncbi:MAG: ATP-binding cassette domain-containing protein, partial [Desulfobacterales bacterium]
MKQTHPIETPFITLQDITIRVRDRFILAHTCWEIKTHQQWAILGPNGAGKSVLVRALAGEMPVVHGKIIHHQGGLSKTSIAYVSFERHRQVIDQDEARDESRFFSGNLANITTARQVILSGNHRKPISQKGLNQMASHLQVQDLLDRGIRFLSTGEIRKVLTLQALMSRPRLLILDEPFEGMDIDSSARLTESINNLMNGNMQIMLVTHRLDEIPSNISHLLCLDNGKIIMQGKRENILNSVMHLYKRGLKAKKAFLTPKHFQKEGKPPADQQKILIVMKRVTVKYGQTVILNSLNWTVKQGENWAILGPNGAGKSTLLSLITGDNPQAYANEIYLFGRRRGSGETVWDIKKLIGIVSSAFQIRYRKPLSVFEV